VRAVDRLRAAGAGLLVGEREPAADCTHTPTLLETTGAAFVADPESLMVEAFGNATLLVRCRDADELLDCLTRVRGALAAAVYLSRAAADTGFAAAVTELLVDRAGRVVENRMPTGLTVSAAMQHGGPWPSAAPPFFSAVGFPGTILRFARRICCDGWSQDRLPECLRDAAPPGAPWRFIDGNWRRG
jgi:NADP-dependent aldehyde dehydrogenase